MGTGKYLILFLLKEDIDLQSLRHHNFQSVEGQWRFFVYWKQPLATKQFGLTPLVFTVRYHCQFPLSSLLPPYIDFHIDILTAMQIQIKMFFVPFNLSNWTRECQNPFSLLVQKERSLGSFFLNWLLSRSRSIHQSIDSQTSENRDNLKRVKSFSTPQRTTSKLCCCWNFKSIFTADKNYKLLSNLWKHFFLSIFQKKRSLKKSSELGKKWKLVLVFWSSFDSEEEELRRRTKKTKVGRWCLGAAGKALSYFYGRTAENYY